MDGGGTQTLTDGGTESVSSEQPDLYICAVSEQSYDRFDQTVDTPYQIEDGTSPPDEVSEIEGDRVWRIRSGKRNQRNFKSLDHGDIVVFFFNDLLFAASRIGSTYDSPKTGKFIWSDEDYRYNYTLTEYQRIDLHHSKLWEFLDYSENFTVNGFKGPASDKVENFRDEVGDIWSYFMNSQTDRSLEDLLRRGGSGDELEIKTGDQWSPPTNIFETTASSLTLDALYFPEAQDTRPLMEQIDDALRSGQHIILTGPPGTGKTELAKAICEHYVNDGYEVVTATDDWSTFDTIGGYRPQENNTLEFKPGVFLRRFMDTENPPKSTNEWLVIDELNRADIDKAFGPFFSALTGNTITLPFEVDGREIEIIGGHENSDGDTLADHRYFIPDDWRLIATMNTDDKASLYNMSYAFMRRFAYISVPCPDRETASAELIRNYASLWGTEISSDAEWASDIEDPTEDIYQPLAEIWGAVQARKPIGPAFLKDILSHLREQLRSEGELDFTYALRMHVFPQFEGAESEVEELINELNHNDDVDGFNAELAKDFVEEFFNIDINLS